MINLQFDSGYEYGIFDAMPIVHNLSRHEAKYSAMILHPDTDAWISIHEPDGVNFIREHITNVYLDKLPNLKIKFWDIEFPVYALAAEEGEQNMCYPAGPEIIKELVDFVVAHKDKNIYVNCAAGKSRSTAVCLFCQNMLGYTWDKTHIKRAIPNMYIYGKMVQYYVTNYKTEF